MKLFIFFIIAAMVFIYFFVAYPGITGSTPPSPYGPNETVYSERLTYFLRDPDVGDPIIFYDEKSKKDLIGIVKSRDSRNNESYIVYINNHDTVKISKTAIRGKIYYPKKVTDRILD